MKEGGAIMKGRRVGRRRRKEREKVRESSKVFSVKNQETSSPHLSLNWQ